MLSNAPVERVTVRELRGGRVALYHELLDGDLVVRRRLVGVVSGWRREAFMRSMVELRAGDEERNFEKWARLRLFISVLPRLRRPGCAGEALDVIKWLPYEELVFWSWKLAQMRKRAVSSFKAMYLRC